MKCNKYLLLFVLVICLYPIQSFAEDSSFGMLTVNKATMSGESMLLKISLSPQTFLNSKQDNTYKEYIDSRLSLEPRSALIGVPHDINGNLSIVKGKFSRINNGVVEEQVYSLHESKVEPPSVFLEAAGLLRQQKIARLRIIPYQRKKVKNPKKKIRVTKFWRSITVKIHFPDLSEKNTYHLKDASSIEKLLSLALVNYEIAQKWRRPITTQQNTLPRSQILNRAIQLTCRQEGLYRITGADLQSAGFDISSVSPEKLRLFQADREIPLYIFKNGSENLTPRSELLFYAPPPPSHVAKYAPSSILWLISGNQAGKRMVTRPALRGHASGHTYSVPVTIKSEKDRNRHLVSKKEKTEQWTWFPLAATSEHRDRRFVTFSNVRGVDKSHPSILKVRVIGSGSKEADRLQITMNSAAAKTVPLKKLEEKTIRFKFSSAHLVPGANAVELEMLPTKQNSTAKIHVDWAKLKYWTSTSRQGRLQFDYKGKGMQQFRLSGFRSTQVAITDISNPYSPILFTKPELQPENSVSVGFQAEYGVRSKERSFFVAERHRLPRPETMELFPATQSLKDPQKGADLLIISPPEFSSALTPLVNLHRKDGLRVEVVSTKDIFREFGWGYSTPDSIRAFLRMACQKWQKPAPSSVLLVGDASWDTQNKLHYGKDDIIPTFYWKHRNKLTPTDYGYTSIQDNDLVPDFHLSRIPAQSINDVYSYVQKVQRYNALPPSKPWMNKALIVSDNKKHYQDLSEYFTSLAKVSGYSCKKNYISSLNLNRNMTMQQRIEQVNTHLAPKLIQSINDGASIVHYAGHGGIRIWAHEHLLNSRIHANHWEKISNKNRLPFILSFSCLNAKFDSLKFDSIAERLLFKNKGGAIAFYGTYGETSFKNNALMDICLSTAMFDNPELHFGAAVTLAQLWAIKQTGAKESLLKGLGLLGDPLLNLKRQTGHSRNTIHKVVRNEHSGYTARSPRPGRRWPASLASPRSFIPSSNRTKSSLGSKDYLPSDEPS